MLEPLKSENINYHLKMFGIAVTCYQKRYGNTIASYCLNEGVANWLKGDELIAIFKTKKLKQNA